jgi:hypothetical protein
VVVPLVDLGDLGREALVVLVEQVVGVLAAVLLEGLGDLRLLLGDHVVPDPAVGQRHRLDQRPVGVHGVAAVQQEVGAAPAHRLEEREAAVRGIDAPALADHVARPDETDVAAVNRGRVSEP